MDFKGQALAETLFTWIILIYSMIGWVYGYIQQDFSFVFYAWSAGVVLAILLCVPDWPFYNRNPVKWLPSVSAARKKVSKKKNE